MNYPLISKLLSVIMVILTLAFALCLGVARYLDTEAEWAITKQAFIAAGLTSTFGAALFFWSGRDYTTRFFRREALCVIGVGWILASLIGAIPYLIIIPDASMADAVFESTSGLTTTGASVLSNLESLPHSLLFWRGLSQWIGGMGVVVFFVAILGFIGVGAKMLYANEASGSVAEFQESRVQSTVLRLISVYAVLSIACCLCYRVGGMGWFDAICHMFTTVSTGGFSTRSASIAAFENPLIEWICIVFMTLGAVSFLLMINLSVGRFSQLRRNSELLAFLVLIAGCTTTIFIVHYTHAPEEGIDLAFRSSAFQVVSIITTTGYATANYANWSSLPQTLLLALMIVGGCSGSTAGGLKVNRILVGIRLCLASIERSYRSMVVRPTKLNQRTLNSRSTQEMTMFILLTLIVLAIAIQFVSLVETDLSMDTNISAAHACLFNIGPGFAEVGPTKTYAPFHSITKFFLSLLMIMGRLELYAILVLFAPSFWRKFS